MSYLTICLPLSLLLTSSLAFPKYRQLIPNGNNVPHPCKDNDLWDGVGHEHPEGGGVLNVFGLAFIAAGREWTQSLCQADSDGDNVTNGEELGDPTCTWTPNTTVSRTVNITHPGICDPYNSDACKSKNTFVSCKLDSFESCQAINNTGVKTINLKFPETEIPASDTTYMCFSFHLPNDQDYHIVANQPLISNKEVHHILLFGCTDADQPLESAPFICDMTPSMGCSAIIGLWTLGLTGSCYGNHSGFRIGKTSYRRVTLQIHYNNPGAEQGFKDSSGLKLYYQPVQEGDQDLAVLTVGQSYLTLPPGVSHIEVEGVCPSSCTRQLVVKPAHIVRSMNHMHYFGTSMTVSVFRNGTKLTNLSYDAIYKYDSPVDHIQNPEFLLLPGDEITTTCIYSTRNSTKEVNFGYSTSDEMCFGFIMFYPGDALQSDQCVSSGKYTECDQQSNTRHYGCDEAQLIDAVGIFFQDVTKNCNLDGCCRPKCRAVLNRFKDHPCSKEAVFQLNTTSLRRFPKGVLLLDRLRSCPIIMDGHTVQSPTRCDPNGGANFVAKTAILLLAPVLFIFV